MQVFASESITHESAVVSHTPSKSYLKIAQGSGSGLMTLNLGAGSDTGQVLVIKNADSADSVSVDGSTTISAGNSAMFIYDGGWTNVGTSSRRRLASSSESYIASDARLKENISPIMNAIDITKSIRGVRYTYKSVAYPDKKLPGDLQIGVLADEVEKVLPEVVNTGDDGFKSVRYDVLTALLIEASKSLTQQVERQDLKISFLFVVIFILLLLCLYNFCARRRVQKQMDLILRSQQQLEAQIHALTYLKSAD